MLNQEIMLYLPIAQAVESLLHPHAEIVIHDLRQNKIVAILNSFSKRKVGDDSLLEEELYSKDIPDFFEPYYKTNWDGRKLKSTTATLRNRHGEAIALLCINLDISKLDEFQNLIAAFTQATKILPKPLFIDDWREKICVFVDNYLKSQSKNLQALTREDKRQLVSELHQEGAFRAKNAAAYVGNVLGISRATVYKYLEPK